MNKIKEVAAKLFVTVYGIAQIMTIIIVTMLLLSHYIFQHAGEPQSTFMHVITMIGTLLIVMAATLLWISKLIVNVSHLNKTFENPSNSPRKQYYEHGVFYYLNPLPNGDDFQLIASGVNSKIDSPI